MFDFTNYSDLDAFYMIDYLGYLKHYTFCHIIFFCRPKMQGDA